MGTRRDCLDGDCKFAGGGTCVGLGEKFGTARLWLDGADSDAGLEVESVCIAKELFDADLRDAALEEIADGGLVFVEYVDQL